MEDIQFNKIEIYAVVKNAGGNVMQNLLEYMSDKYLVINTDGFNDHYIYNDIIQQLGAWIAKDELLKGLIESRAVNSKIIVDSSYPANSKSEFKGKKRNLMNIYGDKNV